MTQCERDEMVLSCEGLVVTIARQWSRSVPGFDEFDLAQEARLVLLLVAPLHDQRRAAWSVFAGNCIRHRLQFLRQMYWPGPLIHSAHHGRLLERCRAAIRCGVPAGVAAERVAEEQCPGGGKRQRNLRRLLRRELFRRRWTLDALCLKVLGELE